MTHHVTRQPSQPLFSHGSLHVESSSEVRQMKLSSQRREELLPLLEEGPGLTRESVKQVHDELRVPESDIWSTASFYSLFKLPSPSVGVCQGLSCQLQGADLWAKELEDQGISVARVSCLGQCDRAPAGIKKLEDQSLRPLYQNETPVSPLPSPGKLAIDLGGQEDLNYKALELARTNGSDWVVNALKEAGLQGRGGAGFPAAFKWDAVRNQAETERYVVCNADEGEPGTFKDRDIILRRPHLLLEGLAIAAQTIQTKEIWIYVRGEFVEERNSLEKAIEEADNNLNQFNFELVSGHGAYICGEETALIESLEGKRGMPRLKPPYPTESGFRQKPTLMNNVETLACIPAILKQGGTWFKKLGRTEAGTKLYCISGHIQSPGVYEMPLGISVNELVDAAGGYVGTPKAFSPGGASSGFLPMSYGDTPLDFGNLGKIGSMLGSAGVVILNDTVSMVDAALNQSVFFEDESCGQCAPCRIGTQLVKRAVSQFKTTQDSSQLKFIQDIGWEMEEGSICGLGMVAAKPIENAMQYFPEEFKGTDDKGKSS